MPPGGTSPRTSARARHADEALPTPREPEPEAALPRAAPAAESKLSGLEQRVLAFEARWWRASGAKVQSIVDELELTPEQYYQHLARLIDHPEAAAEQPAVVRRLRAARAERLGR